MPEFRYQALDSAGLPVSGELQAESQSEAVAHLQSRGLQVESVSLISSGPGTSGAGTSGPGTSGPGTSPAKAAAGAPQSEFDSESEPASDAGTWLSESEFATVAGPMADLAN